MIVKNVKVAFCFILILLCQRLYSYDDQELNALWANVVDINNPTLEEYRLIEHYLRYGQRSYLDPLLISDRYDRIRDLKLVGPNDEMPIFEIHSFNIDDESKERCILLYGTYNGIYPEKARTLLAELSQCGYRGHVLLRIGGFPNLKNGGLKICHIPYSFKVAFLQEAQQLGYKEILWLDVALHPLTNLEEIFSLIKHKGSFLTSVGTLADNRSTHLVEAASQLQIAPELYEYIPHLSSSMIGLNLENYKAINLLKYWFIETEKVYPCITCWPEELSFSVIAWRFGCKPYTWFGNCVCGEHELANPIVRQRPLNFYIDPRR